MKRIYSLILILCVVLTANAKDIVYDFSTSIPYGWTSSTKPNGFESTNLSRGTQFTKDAVLTLAGVKGATKVVITCSANTANNALGVSIGTTSWGNITLPKENNITKTFEGAAADGDLKVEITRTEKSVYIKTITVTCSESTEGGGDNGGGTSTLDPNYTYGEPTTLLPTATEAISNTSYSFVCNNIEVKASMGAHNADYFGCNAGSAITFTATKPIRSIVINGYVKKGFAATASAGDLQYLSDEEEDIEANPVLILNDIYNQTVTLACDKQLRCYSVDVYFTTDPDVELGETGGGDEYSYEWEPTESTTINITFDDAEYEDYSDLFGFAYTDIYFVNDDYELEIAAFCPSVEGTILAPGTYTITDTYEEGTIQASPGGDEEYDYPTFIATDFDAEGYYTTSYYIVSGTLTVEPSGTGVRLTLKGKTYNGSTVTAIYQSDGNWDGIGHVQNTTSTPSLQKILTRGSVKILAKKHTYNLNGKFF